MLNEICYIGEHFSFGFLVCVHYNKDFVISRICSIHFAVSLDRLKNIICFTKDVFLEVR